MLEVLHELVDALATVGRLSEEWRQAQHAKLASVAAPEPVAPPTVPDEPVPTA